MIVGSGGVYVVVSTHTGRGEYAGGELVVDVLVAGEATSTFQPDWCTAWWIDAMRTGEPALWVIVDPPEDRE